MRIRLAIVTLVVLAAAAVALAGRTSLTINTDDHESWVKFERDGTVYFTRDRAVVAEIERAVDQTRRSGSGGGEVDIERRRRALEDERRALEAKMRDLEQRQRDLEDEQRRIEDGRRGHEGEVNRQVEEILQRAVEQGKATKK